MKSKQTEGQLVEHSQFWEKRDAASAIETRAAADKFLELGLCKLFVIFTKMKMNSFSIHVVLLDDSFGNEVTRFFTFLTPAHNRPIVFRFKADANFFYKFNFVV